MSRERNRGDAQPSASAGSASGRGREGAWPPGALPLPRPFPALPSPGRHVGLAEAPGGVGAPGLPPRLGYGTGSRWWRRDPGSPRGVFAQNRSVRRWGPPARHPGPGVAAEFPHSADGNAEAARPLCARRLLPRASRWVTSSVLTGGGDGGAS